MYCHKIGLDIGSTTVKVVVLDPSERVRYTTYRRHNARVPEILAAIFGELAERLGEAPCSLTITGSVGLGIAERCGIGFVQEVVASTTFAERHYPQAATLVDIGGEDAKVVFLNANGTPDMHMNGNCAGGTGAFIDQMAVLLDTTPEGLDALARRAAHIHPIASRCGVFAKTDIQNLAARNVRREEIAASIFHAVAVQTVVTLSHGRDIAAPVLFCGGPLAFLPSLRKAFADYLRLTEEQVLLPDDAQLLPAWGAALTTVGERRLDARRWLDLMIRHAPETTRSYNALQPIFDDEDACERWKCRKRTGVPAEAPLPAGRIALTLGIDSGSTTTKIVALDADKRLLFSYYAPNDGNPVAAVEPTEYSERNLRF